VGYSLVYSFKGVKNGKYPVAGVIYFKGTFYGTTAAGGEYGKGTVFSISSSGVEAVLHSFGKPGSGDGAGPQSRLLQVKDILYGTTVHGGTGTSCPGDGCGTVFWVSPL
jgi:uncharacterized repeat protein (TIGR03803 family)